MSDNYVKLEKLRKEFVQRFDRKKLESLTIDEYSLSGENNALSSESFCHWLETKLKGLGSIKGARADKFGTYFGKVSSDSALKRRWTKWTNEDFNTIRNSLIDLYDAGENEDLKAIKDNELSPNFKGKILSIYFPERYLNVFSQTHLHHFLNKLSLPHNDKAHVVDLRELLIDHKNKTHKFARMTLMQFGIKLYELYGNPSSKEKVQSKSSEELYEYGEKDKMNLVPAKQPPEYEDKPEKPPEEFLNTAYGKVHKIDPKKSQRALFDANYKCEFDRQHESFLRKHGNHKYTEAHHLIPRKYQNDHQNNSLDVTANIVSLCSECHNCLHYGSKYERDLILKKLHDIRENRLKKAGLKISLSELKKLYE